MKPRREKVSIALATHNGQDYLEEQFQSLFSQTRLPDEIVVYDDASSDETLSLLKNLQVRAPCTIEIFAGNTNLHVNGAFGAALERCSGQVVFFSDQDDIWEHDKLARFMDVFESDAEVGLVFCDASQVDELGHPMDGSLWEAVGFTSRRQTGFKRNGVGEMLRSGNFVYGMASAFRLEAIKPFYPIQADPRGMTHDTWFALHALATGWKGVPLEERLVRYRRHSAQATKKEVVDNTAWAKDRLEVRRRQMSALTEALSLVRCGAANASNIRSKSILARALRQLDDKIAYLVLREKLRVERRPQLAMQAMMSLGYWKYAKGPGSVFRDLAGL